MHFFDKAEDAVADIPDDSKLLVGGIVLKKLDFVVEKKVTQLWLCFDEQESQIDWIWNKSAFYEKIIISFCAYYVVLNVSIDKKNI